MTYFNDVDTLEELRKQYKGLLKQYHPDNPKGSTEATQVINAEYDRLFKKLKDKASSDVESEKTSYSNMKYDFNEDEKLREMLNKIINFEGITIEIIGNWLWCFNSYYYRKELNELGFKYAGGKKAWYYHTDAFRKKTKKTLSMNEIRDYYGSTEVNPEKQKSLRQV